MTEASGDGRARLAWSSRLPLLFFGSGAVSLVLEVVWQKRFAQVWGSSALALGAVVVLPFTYPFALGGMFFLAAAGGYWLALALRRRSPLLPLLALLGVMTAAHVVASFDLFALVLVFADESSKLVYQLLKYIGIVLKAVHDSQDD